MTLNRRHLTIKKDRTEYHTFQGAEEMWKFMGEKWKKISSATVSEKGYFSAALSGGKTPVGFYQHLSSVEGLPWDKTLIFLVDERFVPWTDMDSNYKMIRENLLNAVPIMPGNVHPISTSEPSSEISARGYEEEMKTFFELPAGGFPEFDMVLLGIGADGHTASLFPGSGALKEKHRLTAHVKLDASLHDRITLTLPVINNARYVFFLVSGKNKSEVMKKLMDGKDSSSPASMVRPLKGRLMFLMDKEAGKQD